MHDFYHSSSFHQSALMVFVFFSMVLCLYNGFLLSDKHKNKKLHFLNAGIFIGLLVLDALMLHSFGAIQRGSYRETLPFSMWILWGSTLLSFALLLFEAVILLRTAKQNLTRDAVKQAMDTLPGAICYFSPEGVVKLCNLTMYRLFRSLSQSDLQTLKELHQALEECDGQTGVIKLSDQLQTYLFPDGKAWCYSETKVKDTDGIPYTEAVFTDVTELYEDSLKLNEQTKQLAQLARALKQLSFNVQTAAKEQEVLLAKTTLHDQMGAGVLAVRRILQSGKAVQADYALELFQKAVRIIKNDNESPMGRSELDEFLHDAKTIGVKVICSGEMPKEPEAAHAFVLAMRECLTNGVRHAGASEIRISILYHEDRAVLQISNNGAVPQNPVTAKGGLLNLNYTIMNLQGKMEIISFPAFMLLVSIPIGGYENETGTDR